MKKKILIYKIFILFIILSNFIYAEKMILRNGISEKTIDLVNEDRILRMNEMRLRIFFDAIRKQNNKFVLNHLATEENKKKLNENDEKEAKNDNGKYYGPKYSEVIANSSDDIAVNLIDVNAQDQTGYTPIIVAIESGNNEILKVLVENGANLYEKHPVFGKLTLHTACYYENEEAVEDLEEEESKGGSFFVKFLIVILTLMLLAGLGWIVFDSMGGKFDFKSLFGSKNNTTSVVVNSDATPEPTATPATPEPTPETLGEVEVVIDSLNIRGGAGTNFDVVGSAQRGEKFTVLSIEKTSDYTWYQIGENKWLADKNNQFLTYRK